MPLDESAKKRALRMIPYGTFVMGVRNAEVSALEEDVNGFIATWFTQASFDPPMVVVCVKRDSRSHEMVKESGVFTVNVFGAGQKSVAAKFLKKEMAVSAEKGEGAAHAGTMEGVPFTLDQETGCPVFPDLPAWVGCRVVEAVEGENDHTVFVARVVSAGAQAGELKPLEKSETGWTYAG